MSYLGLMDYLLDILVPIKYRYSLSKIYLRLSKDFFTSKTVVSVLPKAARCCPLLEKASELIDELSVTISRGF
jgi:hypothetical protein